MSYDILKICRRQISIGLYSNLLSITNLFLDSFLQSCYAEWAMEVGLFFMPKIRRI